VNRPKSGRFSKRPYPSNSAGYESETLSSRLPSLRILIRLLKKQPSGLITPGERSQVQPANGRLESLTHKRQFTHHRIINGHSVQMTN